MSSEHPAKTDRAARGVLRHRPRVFGHSRLGSPLEFFLPDSAEPSLLIVAGQHGDEPETTSLLSSALRTLPSSALKAAAVLALNPDGLTRGTRCNAAGVDLNRNFPVPSWGEGEIVYRWTSQDPRDVRLSPGTAPGSEPETAAFLSLLEAVRPDYVVSMHAPLACIECPLKSPLAAWLSTHTALPLVADIGYPTPGSFGSWALAHALKVVTWELPHLPLEELRLRFEEPLLELLTSTPRQLLATGSAPASLSR